MAGLIFSEIKKAVLRARGFIRFSPVEVENHVHRDITDAHGSSTFYLA